MLGLCIFSLLASGIGSSVPRKIGGELFSVSSSSSLTQVVLSLAGEGVDFERVKCLLIKINLLVNSQKYFSRLDIIH